jgi:glucose-6-phosphate isomerase
MKPLTVANVSPTYDSTLQELTDNRIIDRIWASDYTVWASKPDEIDNRLGWLRLPETMQSGIARIEAFVESVRREGFSHAVLLGMGGSSLAPDMLSRIFGPKHGFLDLQVLDSTHPESILRVASEAQAHKTLFIVATKSGTTSETRSLFRYFYQWLLDQGNPNPGQHFIAITDPESPLVELADRFSFREVFLNDPTIGGRYSALSYFGLVPAALLGLDLHAWLQQARAMSDACSAATPVEGHPAAQLGCFLGAEAKAGRDKATLLLSRSIAPFGDWIEQLIAESSGKDGTGILPVLETLEDGIGRYSEDRAFIIMTVGDDPLLEQAARRLEGDGHPIARIRLSHQLDLAGQIFQWELAVAIACHILGVHPFNQPNVESAKRLARAAAAAAQQSGQSEQPQTTVHPPLSANALRKCLEDVAPGAYIGIHAYLPASDSLSHALAVLQRALRDRYGVAVTVGYGPRFLHSTGQLHKGDRGNGHFVQLLSEVMPVAAIPDEAGCAQSSLSFGQLITSQAHGDRQALAQGGRTVCTHSVAPPYAPKLAEIADQV